MSINGVEIKVGQVWQTHAGERVTIMRNDGHGRWSWVGSNGRSYGNDGSVYAHSQNESLNLEIYRAEDPVVDVRIATPCTIFDEQPIDMHVTGYHTLANVLQKAYNQAAVGKGAERHANSLPFHEQPMTTINRALGSVDGFIYQAHKKSLEAKRLPAVDRQVAELLGAINYLAGAVIALERDRRFSE